MPCTVVWKILIFVCKIKTFLCTINYVFLPGYFFFCLKPHCAKSLVPVITVIPSTCHLQVHITEMVGLWYGESCPWSKNLWCELSLSMGQLLLKCRASGLGWSFYCLDVWDKLSCPDSTSELQIKGVTDNFPYFSIKTYVVTPIK